MRFLKPTLLVGALAFAFAGVAPAQRDDASLAALRDKKLELAFLKKASWTTDYDAALADAKKNGKLIFAYFTRSYAKWGPCDALEASALSDAAFPEFGKKVVLLCHITSQVSTDKHQDLLRKKGGAGFPYLAFLDAEGNVLTAQRDRTVKGFEASLVNLAAWSDLKKKADGGDKAAKAELVVVELEMGKLEADAAKAALKDLPALSKDAQARFDVALIGVEVATIMKGARTAEAAAEAGRKFAEMLKAGRAPKGDVSLQFYAAIMQGAETDGDAALFETALTAMRAEHGEKPGIKRFLELADKRLADVKAGKKPESRGGPK